MIDQEQLREAFLALAGQLPEPFNLVGVTYGGPGGRGEWVASLHRVDDDTWCEGWGDSPIEALIDLRSHLHQEHPEVFAEIS